MILVLCSCAQKNTSPRLTGSELEAWSAKYIAKMVAEDEERAARLATEEAEKKRVKDWPMDFASLIGKPTKLLINKWGTPHAIETDQSGAHTYSWFEVDVMGIYSPSVPSSKQSIYDKNGYHAGYYTVPEQPSVKTGEVSSLSCEIIITDNVKGIITKTRYSGQYCPTDFPLPDSAWP
jgi:hypothetical protein